MLGTVTVSRLLGSDETAGQFSLVELRGLPGSGPGPHIDPWRESFYVLEGELTFRYEQDGAVRSVVAARATPSRSPPASATLQRHQRRIRALPDRQHAGGHRRLLRRRRRADRQPELPDDPPPFDRERLLAAFDKHGLTPYSFPS